MSDFDFQADAGLAALGQGIKGFAQGWQDAEDRKMKKIEMESKAEAQKSERERQRFMDGLTARDKGFATKPGQDIYTQDPATLERSPDWHQQQEARAAADPFGLKAVQAQNAQLEGQRKRQEIDQANQDAQRKKLSPVQGYQKTDNYVATPAEEKDIRGAQGDILKFNNTMAQLRQRVENADKTELANPWSDTAKAIKNDMRDLQLIYKSPAFAQLGVLTGPDLKLLEEIIENPGTISNLASGKDGVLSRYDQARDRVNNNFRDRLSALGLAPEQQAAPMPAKGGGKIKPTPLQKAMTPLEKSGAPPANDLAAKQKRLEELKRKAAGG